MAHTFICFRYLYIVMIVFIISIMLIIILINYCINIYYNPLGFLLFIFELFYFSVQFE
jgi:hypothetical protein